MTPLNNHSDPPDNEELELEIVDLDDVEHEVEKPSRTPSRSYKMRNKPSKKLDDATLLEWASFWPKQKVRMPIVVMIFLLGLLTLTLMSGGWAGLVGLLSLPSSPSSVSAITTSSCIGAAELSPNQKIIAVMEREYCNFAVFSRANNKIEGANIRLFDAHSQKPLAQISLAQAILEKASKLSLTAQEVRDGISYLGLSWSPDGKKLICAFYIMRSSSSPTAQRGAIASQMLAGLVEVSFPLHLTVSLVPGNNVQSTRFFYLSQVWDEPQGKLVPQDARMWDASAKAGLQWDSNGHLVTRISQSTQDLTVGSPHNGEGFTFWQPGSMHVVSSGTVKARREYIWSAACISWSPDGRYLAVLYWNVRITMPGNTGLNKDEIKRYSLEGVPAIDVHDKALATLAKEEVTAPGLRTFALRPDGRVLAAFNRQNNHIEWYDCVTGRMLKSDAVSVSSDGGSIASNMLAYSILQWSPDGKTLFLALRSGALQLWQGNALPVPPTSH
ncbi:DPP IV N-terminal domain-containing protein [Ktedonospora formicarum]|uniref:Uncharacterized protein n=1 Tax=Ktedonospora formicarum TaxID=2778364 RepID=A0A8J3I0R2_9CHLR|nr:DPP IV N-terminal domain-containing protein [Ktedonospora formicarum]GHO44107.1 hypothetical protein KSX_22700 [Ktedonospora formicarum]